MTDTTDSPLTNLDQLTPAWLTIRLRQIGYLSSGQVTTIQKGKVFSNNSDSVKIQLDYSVDAPTERLPRHLFIKIAKPDFPWNHMEFDFYTMIVPEMQQQQPNSSWPFPICYDAAYTEGKSGAHLILEDLSTTHRAADAPLPPTPTQAQSAVTGLAAFHAYWWEDSRLGIEIGKQQTSESLTEMINWARGNYSKWSIMMRERLSVERKEILDTIFTDWPQFRKKRLLSGQGITLVHRDTHPLNFLYPYNEALHAAKIVDWQSWRVDSALDDLAYMIACHWYPEYRQRLEQPLLRYYHRQLLHHGVKNYEWEICWYDYQASVIHCLFFLLANWNEKRSDTMWWDRLEKGLLAFEDLGCKNLLS